MDKLRLNYSEQAKIMLKNLKEFNCNDFEEWFLSNLKIGSNDILEYLIHKTSKKQEVKQDG